MTLKLTVNSFIPVDALLSIRWSKHLLSHALTSSFQTPQIPPLYTTQCGAYVPCLKKWGDTRISHLLYLPWQIHILVPSTVLAYDSSCFRSLVEKLFGFLQILRIVSVVTVEILLCDKFQCSQWCNAVRRLWVPAYSESLTDYGECRGS